MILVVLSSLVLLYHLTKGVIYLFKGVASLVVPLFSKRERIKKTPEYKAFCKNIDLNLFNQKSTTN